MNNLNKEIIDLKRYWIAQQITTSIVFGLIYVFMKINIGKILLPILTYQDYLNVDLILPVLNSTRSLLIYVVAFSFVSIGLVFVYDSFAKWVFKITEYLAYVNITFFTALTIAGIFFSRSLFNDRGGVLVHDLNTYIIIFDILLLIFGFLVVYSNVTSLKLIMSITGRKCDKNNTTATEVENIDTDKNINEL